MRNPYEPPGQTYGQPVLTRRVTRMGRPTLRRFINALVLVIALMYSASVPFTLYWIQDSGLGFKPHEHHSLGEILFGLAMIGLVWTPLTLMTMSWFLGPPAALLALVCASVHRVHMPISPAGRR